MKLSKLFNLATMLSVCGGIGMAQAHTEITVYNQNLALIKKQLEQKFSKGINEIVFDEVARNMLPESAYIYGDGVRILDQNYDYANVNYQNLLKANVGKTVKTVRENPTNGNNIFEKALLLSVGNGQPVLKFDYGIETKFPGRVVFENVPKSLNSTPVLKAQAEVLTVGAKDVHLAYLTSGFSWDANYVAKIKDDKNIELLGRVSLRNNSGSNFEDVKVNLVAGEVNKVIESQPRRFYATRALVNDMVMASAPQMKAVIDEPTTLNGYYVYNLPNNTNLEDGQIKQVSFADVRNVKYRKENIITSTLSFLLNKSFYKGVRPDIRYTFGNEKDNGLGFPLPEGKISFYEYDKNGELQFVGEDKISNKAEGEKIEVALGKTFDVYSNAKIKNIQKVTERKYKKEPSDKCVTVESSYLYDVSYEVINKGKYAENIILKQNLPHDASIINETIKSVDGDGNDKVWKFTIAPKETKEIEVSLQNKIEVKNCD